MKKELLILILILMSVWGLLGKSLIDNETIEAAIDRIVAAHNDDETSHLETGQSLQSHKASEIIDHLAKSVVTDKLNLDKFYIHTQFESEAGWSEYGTAYYEFGLGALFINPTDIIDQYRALYASPLGGISWAKNPAIQYFARFDYDVAQVGYLGCGGMHATLGSFFGFKVLNGTLYACHQKDANEYLTEITGIDVTVEHIYRAEYTSETEIKFFIDGELKATHDSNLPEDADQTYAGRVIFLYLRNTGDANEKLLHVSDCWFTRDL